MKNLPIIILVTYLCFYSVAAGDIQVQEGKPQPSQYAILVLDISPDPTAYPISTGVSPTGVPQRQVPPAFHVRTKGIVVTSIGTVVMLAGMALPASV